MYAKLQGTEKQRERKEVRINSLSPFSEVQKSDTSFFPQQEVGEEWKQRK